MFDRFNKYFLKIVHVGEQDSQKKGIISALIIPMLVTFPATILSLLSLGVSYLSFAANQEGLKVFIETKLQLSILSLQKVNSIRN